MRPRLEQASRLGWGRGEADGRSCLRSCMGHHCGGIRQVLPGQLDPSRPGWPVRAHGKGHVNVDGGAGHLGLVPSSPWRAPAVQMAITRSWQGSRGRTPSGLTLAGSFPPSLPAAPLAAPDLGQSGAELWDRLPGAECTLPGANAGARLQGSGGSPLRLWVCPLLDRPLQKPLGCFGPRIHRALTRCHGAVP